MRAGASGRVQHAEVQALRNAERTGRCDTAYQRCVRDCTAPDATAGASAILTPQGLAKRKAAAGEAR